MVIRNILYYHKFQIIQVLVRSIIRIFIRLLEFIPVFIGFSLLGSLIFWKSHFFTNTSRTAMTQFCLMTGDSIRDITQNMVDKTSFFTAILYSITFVMLYMHIIHNILIAIVRDGFA